MRHFFDQVLNPSSQVPAAGVQVAVYPHGSGTLATIYADAGITIKANPLTTDSTGSYDFYVADGRYDINISGANIIPKTLSDVSIFDASGSSATVVSAADLAGADACVKINTAIGLLPATGGTIDARGFQGLQICNTAISYTGNTKGVTVLQGASTLQFSNSVASPAISLSGAGSEWRGIGPVANTTGSSVIQAGTGFSGVLFRVGTTSGDTNLAIRNVKIDGNSEAAVTAGLELTANNINWTVLDEVSVVNVTSGSGILFDSGAQIIHGYNLFQRNNAICMDMSAGQVHEVWMFNSRFFSNGYVYLIGSDDAVSGNRSNDISHIGGDVAVTPSADGTKPMVLVRNAAAVEFVGVRSEYSSAASGTTNALYQLGTANTAGLPPNGFAIRGGNLVGNNKANYGVDIENATYPRIEPTATSTINTQLVLNNSTTSQGWVVLPGSNGGGGGVGLVSSTTGLAYAFGGSPQFTFTPYDYAGTSGNTFLGGRVTADTFDRIILQNHGVLRFGPGSGATDIGISRSGASTLAVGTGAQGSTAGNISAAAATFTSITDRNSTDSLNQLIIDSGATTSQTSQVTFQDQGVNKYLLKKDAGTNFVLFDSTLGANRLAINTGANNVYNVPASQSHQFSVNGIQVLSVNGTVGNFLGGIAVNGSQTLNAVSGNAAKIVTASGSFVSGNTVKADASGNLVDAGSPPVGFTAVNITPVTVNANTAADQNLQAVTVTAGVLNSIGKTLSVYVAGNYSTPAASTSTVQMKLKLCSVSGCGSGTVLTLLNITSPALGAVQATNDPFVIQAFSSTQTAGASAAFEAHGTLSIDTAALATAAMTLLGDNNTATIGTIDSTAQLFLQSTIAFSNASASNVAVGRQMLTDVID